MFSVHFHLRGEKKRNIHQIGSVMLARNNHPLRYIACWTIFHTEPKLTRLLWWFFFSFFIFAKCESGRFFFSFEWYAACAKIISLTYQRIQQKQKQSIAAWNVVNRFKRKIWHYVATRKLGNRPTFHVHRRRNFFFFPLHNRIRIVNGQHRIGLDLDLDLDLPPILGYTQQETLIHWNRFWFFSLFY